MIDALRSHIRHYLEGKETLNDLRAWRRANIDQLSNGDEATQTLHDHLTISLAELAIDALDEPRFRGELNTVMEQV